MQGLAECVNRICMNLLLRLLLAVPPVHLKSLPESSAADIEQIVQIGRAFPQLEMGVGDMTKHFV